MTDLVVRTVRIRHTPPGPSRVAAEAVLRSMAPTAEDHGVLIVRRLWLDGFRGDMARYRLAEARRRAARPVVGPSGLQWSEREGEAVWFADEAEALACLTADLIAGSAASRWYWRFRLPSGPFGGSRLAQVWLRDARWLPAALQLLESCTPGASARAVAALTAPEAALVLAALLPNAGAAAPLRATAPRRNQRHGDQVAQLEHEPLPPARTVGRWSRLLPPGAISLPPGQRELLAVATVLAVEPAAPIGDLRTWARTVDILAAPLIVAGHEGPLAKDHASAANVSAPDNRPAAAGSDQPMTILDANKSAGSGWDSVQSSTPPDFPGVESMPSIARTQEIDPPEASDRPLPFDHSDPKAYDLLDRWTGAVWSGHATAFYLLNLLLRIDDEPSWVDLARFGRRVLRGQPRARRRARDPLWHLLRNLAGADQLLAGLAPSWWQVALAYLSDHSLTASMFAQPGRIAVSRTHVDVILDLEQIDLAVRSSGLDQNPGWVRSLGRIVSFHFDDAQRSRR